MYFGIFRGLIAAKKYNISGDEILCPSEWQASTFIIRHNTHLSSLEGQEEARVDQQTIFLINLGIFHHISPNVGVRKKLKYFWDVVYKQSGEHCSGIFVTLCS
jgi:hypothetical protein